MSHQDDIRLSDDALTEREVIEREMSEREGDARQACEAIFKDARQSARETITKYGWGEDAMTACELGALHAHLKMMAHRQETPTEYVRRHLFRDTTF